LHLQFDWCARTLPVFLLFSHVGIRDPRGPFFTCQLYTLLISLRRLLTIVIPFRLYAKQPSAPNCDATSSTTDEPSSRAPITSLPRLEPHISYNQTYPFTSHISLRTTRQLPESLLTN
jgi:hypothetical protein